jgi:hypothetical protein
LARRRRILRVSFWRVLAVLGIEAWCIAARADDATRAQLDYEAPDDCPSQADFEHAIGQRTQRLRFVSDSSANARYKVVLTRNAKGQFTGRLLSGASGAAKIEIIQGQSCADVVSALGLNLALLVDPDAMLDVPAPPSPPAQARKEEPSPVAPAQQAPRAHWLALAQWAMRGAMGQVASVGGGLVGEYWSNRYGAFAPVVRLDVTYSFSSLDISGAEATFRLLQAAPGFCPLRVGESALRWLPLCGAVELGTIQVSSAGVVVPLRRYEFVFEDPTTVVYSMPSFGVYGSVLVGVPF